MSIIKILLLLLTFTIFVQTYIAQELVPFQNRFDYSLNENQKDLDGDENHSNNQLRTDSVFIPPYNEDFESLGQWWDSYAKAYPYGSLIGTNYWEKGNNSIHKIYGTHSGDSAWFISTPPTTGASSTLQYLESPLIDFSDNQLHVICFWYKVFNDYDITSNIELELSNQLTTPYHNSVYGSSSSIPSGRFNDWDCRCEELSYLMGSNPAKIRILLDSYAHYNNWADHMVIDDVYIGHPLPDLSIEHNHSRILNLDQSTDTLYYMLFNSGLSSAPASRTEFYWSVDSILDGGDLYLGDNVEPVLSDTNYIYQKFGFSVPLIAAGNYYLIGITDADSLINEMWESNNVTVFPVVLDTNISLPYFNDFETQADGWYHYSLFGIDDWEWDSPSGSLISNAFSGQNAFITNPNGLVSSQSMMLLYTPQFNLSSLNNPVLEFDMTFDNYNNITLTYNMPHMNMSYSYDNGATWHVLDTAGLSYKSWYYSYTYSDYSGMDYTGPNSDSHLLFDTHENTFSASNAYQSRDAHQIYRYILDLSHLSPYSKVQFRYNFVTPTVSLGEGVLIDNFSIAEKYIDLTIENTKNLYKSSLSEELKLFTHINNTGNYISNPTTIDFYLSVDSIYNAGDQHIGTDTIPSIAPGSKYYHNTMKSCSSSLSGYNYLIYQIDQANLNTESDEINNIGFFPLNIDGVQQYPYLNDFNDTIIDGWTHYTIKNLNHITSSFRIRNYPAVNEMIPYSSMLQGVLFTDKIKGSLSISSVPYWYIESPNFNFSNLGNILMTFDLMCMGRNNDDGGNLEFSTDGGDTWTLLTTSFGNASNWYNCGSLSDLNNEPGWTDISTTLDSRSFDISFLAGQPSVIFRFKYRSNRDPYSNSYQGLRLDNFRIEEDSTNKIDRILHNDIAVYPNPANNEINVSGENIVSIELLDMTGNSILIETSDNQINISNIAVGMYLLKVNTKGKSYSKKIIIN